MDIAIIGAAGAIGRRVATTLVERAIVPSTAMLQLVGRAGSTSERILPSMIIDLQDAYAETAPRLYWTCDPGEVCADLIVCCAGLTPPANADAIPDRNELVAANLPIVRDLARHIADNGHGEELLLVVSNPVEILVHEACLHLPRERVIGLGSHLDSMRFRLEIARELGVPRQAVQGLVLGEHGMNMVPCWSTVDAYGFSDPIARRRLDALRRHEPEDLRAAMGRCLDTLREQGCAAAFATVDSYDPATRAFLRPIVTHCSGARTPVASAAMISEVVAALVSGHGLQTAAQVMCAGEFRGVLGVTGAPVSLSRSGVRVHDLILDERESECLSRAVEGTRSLWEQHHDGH